MHMNRLSFTMKWWPESLLLMSAVLRKWVWLARLTHVTWVISTRRWWSVCSSCDKQEVRCHACLNLSCLRYGCQHCTLAVTQHCPSPIEATYLCIYYSSIFRKYLNPHLIRPQASKHVCYKHISAMQSHSCEGGRAWVGLTQARPNW